MAFIRDAVTEAGTWSSPSAASTQCSDRQRRPFTTSVRVHLRRSACLGTRSTSGYCDRGASEELGIKDFSNETLRLTERAADVSATFGGTAKDAVEAFNSALKGEYNPIEKYGVKLSEATVNAALAAKGLDGLKGAALEQAKAQERVNLIMAQTADHAGRFAEEANTLQGQQQRLTAAWQDAKAELGQSLLPVP